MDAAGDYVNAETILALVCDASEHGVSVTSAWLNIILHFDHKKNVTEKTSNADLVIEIADVYGSDTEDGDIECDGDEALPRLQKQPECLTVALHVPHNSGHLTEECNKAFYNCQRRLRDEKRQTMTQRTISNHFMMK